MLVDNLAETELRRALWMLSTIFDCQASSASRVGRPRLVLLCAQLAELGMAKFDVVDVRTLVPERELEGLC